MVVFLVWVCVHILDWLVQRATREQLFASRTPGPLSFWVEHKSSLNKTRPSSRGVPILISDTFPMIFIRNIIVVINILFFIFLHFYHNCFYYYKLPELVRILYYLPDHWWGVNENWEVKKPKPFCFYYFIKTILV